MADPAIAALNSLLRSTGIEDHAEALRLANAAIKATSRSPGSAELHMAQRTKVVALLKLDRYEDALRTIAEGGDRLASECALEHSYALYKTGRPEDAAAAAAASPPSGSSPSPTASPSRGARHVSAQVAYRAERFEQAARTYRELVEAVGAEGRAGEEGDLRINMLAAAAQLEWAGRGHGVPEAERTPSRQDMETFDAAYNAACGCLARSDLGRAAVLLKRARDLCEASEDLGEDEKQAELVPIVVQETYALLRLGKVAEAMELQKRIGALSEISDAATRLVAQNNSQVLDQSSNPDAPYNPYMAARVAESFTPPTGNSRLFECQAAILRRNKQVIELQCHKFPGVRRSTASVLKRPTDPSSPSSIGPPATSPEATNLGVLHAAAVSHLQTGKDALRSILPLLESRPDDIGLLLTIIQLYIQTKNPAPALTLLEAFFRRLEAATTPDHADVRFAPGLVALAVALYRLQGRPVAVRAELGRAAAYWQGTAAAAATRERNQDDSERGGAAAAMSLLRQAGVELLHSPDPADHAAAGAAFSRLCGGGGEGKEGADRLAEAGLVASFATSDFSRAAPHLSVLTPVEKLTSGVDVGALIDAGVASFPAATLVTKSELAATAAKGKKRGAAADGTAAAAAAPAAKKPRRRTKLPKDHDPDKKPDPERWLPLRDRSSYRPKGKKGKKRAAEATQGGPVKEEETLELVGGAGAVKVEKAPVGGGGAGGKKGKKKGKK